MPLANTVMQVQVSDYCPEVYCVSAMERENIEISIVGAMVPPPQPHIEMPTNQGALPSIPATYGSSSSAISENISMIASSSSYLTQRNAAQGKALKC
jgi:hypothetical protein